MHQFQGSFINNQVWLQSSIFLQGNNKNDCIKSTRTGKRRISLFNINLAKRFSHGSLAEIFMVLLEIIRFTWLYHDLRFYLELFGGNISFFVFIAQLWFTWVITDLYWSIANRNHHIWRRNLYATRYVCLFDNVSISWILYDTYVKSIAQARYSFFWLLLVIGSILLCKYIK